ncbi:hypothetical protein E2320_003388 [Naja naja]|nr:hypothetical protein E2320_003388 [Naja naja]
MHEEFNMGPSSPVRRGELQEVSDKEETSRPRYENPTGETSETTELLFITPAEQKLWKQLLELLSPSLWEVKVSGAPQSNSPAISLTGCPEVVSRAKKAISKLLIFVGCQIQINHMDLPQLKAVGFFQLQKGFHLFLWEGKVSHIRVDAVVRIGTSSSLDDGNAVLAQRVLSPEGSLYTNLDIHFSCPPTGELAAGMIKLALQAAWRKGFQSVIVTHLGPTISTAEAKVIVLGMEAFRKNHTVGPLKSLHVVSGDELTAKLLYKEGVHAITQKVLETVPQCRDLSPGDILLVPGSTFVELDCRMIYLVRLDDLQLKPEEAHKPVDADPAMVWEWILILMEEVNQFLKNFPNTWMKLIKESLSFAAEPVGLCRTEEPLFLQYLVENSSAFSEFQGQLKKAGYDIQIDLNRKLLVFQAIDQSVQLLGLDKSFEFVRKKYVLHHETREEILKVLHDHQRHTKRFGSLRIYFLKQIWFVGLLDEINCFLQYLTHEAFQRELVSWECTAEPVLWYTIAKDVILQEFLPSNPMIKFEIIANAPATIRLEGSRKTVKEVERHLKELLNSFQVLPVPFSDFQLQFVTAHWGKVFYNHFFLQRSIPVVLELSQVVQIAGLDLGKMKEAEEILMNLVCERVMEIAEDLKWATEVSEWKLLLFTLSLGTHKEVAIHHVAPGWVILVGFCPKVIQVEESIKKYLRENSLVEEKVKLARPELAFAGNGLLHIIGWEHLRMNVTLQVKSQPSVLQVTGLQKFVKNAMPAIKRELDSLVLGIIPLRKGMFREYIFGIGAGLLKNMAWQLGCIAGLKTEEFDNWKNMNEDFMEERCATGFSGEIYVIGKWKPTNLLKQSMAGLFVQFCTKSICHEACATFKNMDIDEFLRNISHKFPVDIRWLQDSEIQIYGFQKDVENVLEAVHEKIEKYYSEIIEVQVRYESVPYTVISLFQKIFPKNPLVSIEVLANDSVTIIFRGPRQKLVEVKRHFEEFLRSFQFLPVSLSELQLQFVKAQWDKLFYNGFFWERNFPAVLEISETVQIGGLSMDEIKEAEKILMEEVYEKYQSEIIEVKAQYESVPSTVIKESLFQKRFPTSPLVSTEVLANDPATIIFKGPRQKLVELKGHFEELLSGFQFLPVCLSKLQLQFVKVQWGKLFHNGFFWERNIPAILEISEIVQIGGLSVGEIKKAENILMKQVCEKTVEIADQLQWVTKEPEWEGLLNRLKSQKEVAIHYTSSNQVTVVGPSLQTAAVENYIEEYLRDNSPLKESMMLTKPELVLAGESILHIMNWEHLKVNIKFKSGNYVLSVHVIGLQKFVKKAIPVIKKGLHSLVFDTIPLKKKALRIYFSEDGADLLKNMADTQNCIVRMQTQESHRSSNDGVLQGLAEDDRAVIFVAGIQSKVTSLKQHLSDFIAKFHKETICNAEISTFTDDGLKALCKTIPPQYPVGFHRLREKVVLICGSQEDVENISRKIYTKLEEVLTIKIQKAEAEQTVSKLLYETIRWHHKSDAGWSTFDMLTNRYLEETYREKKMEALVPWNGEKLKINFLTNEAFIQGKRKFKIRRDICLWDKNITPFWETMHECLIKKVELQMYSREYQDVVERIQNRYLWVSYCWKKSWMEKKNPERTQNERILYHGTQPDKCSSICDIGFKSAFRKKCLFGQGIYFSVPSINSVFYTKPDSQGLRYIFQARVLTGEYSAGKENMILPPIKPDGNGLYDSLVDFIMNPNIFVIFFDDYAYPEYLITFHG